MTNGGVGEPVDVAGPDVHGHVGRHGGAVPGVVGMAVGEQDGGHRQATVVQHLSHRRRHPGAGTRPPRPGTPAARMPQIAREIAKERAARLRARGDEALIDELRKFSDTAPPLFVLTGGDPIRRLDKPAFSLSGMVSFGTGLMGIGHGLTTNSGLRGSFFTGVLAAVVASPCTGPMIAPALGFALTQPPVSALLVFVALGLGMALPFLLLSYSPGFARMLPRPGAWMEKLKEFLAFPMYLTAAWLLFVFGRQVGLVALFFLCAGAVAIAIVEQAVAGRADEDSRGAVGEERVVVNEIAGTTRDAIDVRFEMNGRSLLAIDTAGVRKRSKLADSVEYWALHRMLNAVSRADVCMLLIDATKRILSEGDAVFIESDAGKL